MLVGPIKSKLPESPPDATVRIELTVNGEAVSADVSPRMLLSDFLRHELGLTGTHVGCEHGVCGACTVIIDGASGRSCLTFAVQASGADVRTIESVAAKDGTLHPIQQAFRDCHGLQCGYCTPGMVMSASDLLRHNPAPTRQQICEGLEGNICRCTGYQHIMNVLSSFNSDAPLDLTDEGIRDILSGNLCRCTGYQNIVDAVRQAAKAMSLG